MAKFVFLGDLKLTDKSVRVGSKLQKIVSDAHYVIANLEGPVTQQDKPRADKKGVALKNGLGIRRLIDDLAINVLLLGNNHIYDFGEDGLLDTLSFCESRNISCAGAQSKSHDGSDIVRLEEAKVAIFSYAHQEGPVSRGRGNGYGPYALPKLQDIINQINELKSLDYLVIVVYHGGEEYFNFPWPRRMGWCRRLIDSGANLVIGTHSHSVQPVYQVAPGHYIASGLGNTYFEDSCQSNNIHARDSIALEFDSDSGRLAIHRIKADFEKCDVDIINDVSQPIDFSMFNQYFYQNWSKESRQYITGSLNRGSKRAARGEWWKRFIRPSHILFHFIRRIGFKKNRNIRDIDILLCSLPIFGKFYSKKIYAEGQNEFSF